MRVQHGRFLLVVVLLVLLVGCGSDSGTTVRRGGVAPDFTLEDLNGSPVSLSDFKGRPVLINFWASWCPPCRSEMPELQQAYAAQGEEGLVILAVNALYQDDLKDVEKFVAEQKLTFPILLDRDGKVVTLYRVGPFPTSVFVNPNGTIHLVQVGAMTRQFVESVLRDMAK